MGSGVGEREMTTRRASERRCGDERGATSGKGGEDATGSGDGEDGDGGELAAANVERGGHALLYCLL